MSSLLELNASSAALAEFPVAVYRPECYTYEFDAEGTTKTNKMFRCILVSTINPAAYCEGQVKMMKGKATMTDVEQANDKFKANHCFKLSKVALKSGINLSYIHTPKQVVWMGWWRLVVRISRSVSGSCCA